MNQRIKPRVGVFPGSFDPLTNGHLDVIRRAAKLFDELVIAVGENPDKADFLDPEVRERILRETTTDLPNVRIERYAGLTADFARRCGAMAILRGIRDSADLHREFQLALTNRAVAGIETILIMSSAEEAFTSSSLIKQVAQMGGDVSQMVPPAAMEAIRRRCSRGK